MTPPPPKKKYPQNLHAQKYILFSENPKKVLKVQILNPIKRLSLRMHENIWGVRQVTILFFMNETKRL